MCAKVQNKFTSLIIFYRSTMLPSTFATNNFALTIKYKRKLMAHRKGNTNKICGFDIEFEFNWDTRLK